MKLKFSIYFLFFALFSINALAQQSFGLFMPPNNAKCAPPDIHLAWYGATGFNYYKLVVALDSNLTNIVYQKDSITIFYEGVYNLNYATKYYWQVIAWKINDTTTLKSEIWNFTTNYQPATLVFPTDSSFCINRIVKFTWNAEPGAKKYVLQLSRTPTFTGPTVTYDTIVAKNDTTAPDTFKLINNLLSNTRYWWRVRAIYNDCEAYWSPNRTFRTVPDPMVLISPADGAYGTEVFPVDGQFNVNFKWSLVNDAQLYHLQITDYIQKDSLLFETTTVDTAININGLNFAYNKTYYWRVRAFIANDSVNCFTEYSKWYSFKSPYKAPVLTIPANNSTCIKFEQALNWKPSIDTTLYEIIVSSKPDFSDTLHWAKNIADTLVGFPFSKELSDYYWKVRAVDSKNNSYWSAPFKFTTTLLPPGFENPIDSAGGYALTVHYVWKHKGNGAKYALQVSDKSDFSNLIVDVDNLTERTFTVNHTEYFKYYYWRVKAYLNGCASDWSRTFVFRTKLPAPILQTPENNAQNVNHTPTFTWKAVSGARSYDFMLDTKSNFSTAIIRNNIPANEIRLVQILNENTTYYWRVRAVNEEGASDWSQTFTFTTAYYLPETPRIISPQNETTKHPINGLKLVWSSALRAQTYELQVTKLPEFTQLVVNATNLIDTTYILNNLEHYTVYLFRVRAVNQGGPSEWSLPYAFRTINVAPTTPPDLTVPANNAQNQPLGLRLTWLPVQRAEAYRVQVATDEQFQNLFANELEVYLTYLNIYNLSPNTTYYWRVKAWNEAGEGPWSEVRQFKTMDLTSVNETNYSKYNLNVYPNPSSNNVQISFNYPSATVANISLYNIQGMKVLEMNNHTLNEGINIINLDLNNLPAGIYSWQIETKNEILKGNISKVK